MDGDGDGLISSNNIDLSKIGDDLLELFKKMLVKMEKEQMLLDLEEFKILAWQHIKRMNVE